MKTFGAYARERIKRLGKSQKDLANLLGVSPAYISQILTGKKNPPDLGKSRNRGQLEIWAGFLSVNEEDVLDQVRHELHRVPLKPGPRFYRMRHLLLARLSGRDRTLAEEIRSLELHPAENMAISAMVQIYLMLREDANENRAYGRTRFRELCRRARGDKEFVEGVLTGFFQTRSFSWTWDSERSDVQFRFESEEIQRAILQIEEILRDTPRLAFRRTVPVVGHVSAGEGFAYTDGGYPAGEGFEQVEMPPGVDPALGPMVYCVRVRGNSLKEFINEGARLFVKPESWEEIRDGDLVIFKDRVERRAFVKKVEFSGENLILKSMNPLYKHIVLKKSDLILLERVIAIVF
ncbi:MAG: XRE family transcriptional regulator [Deltaproteobacteria bacterium]